MVTHKETTAIGGNTYFVVYEDTDYYQRVSIYDKSIENKYPNDTDIVYRKQKKPTKWRFWRTKPTPREKFIREALVDAHNMMTTREEAFDNALTSAAEAFAEA